MLFYNDEATENGGLIFGGQKDAKGNIVDSGGALSFDKYGSRGQLAQFAGVDDKDDQFSGMTVNDSSPDALKRRLWIGKDKNGASSVALMDANGCAAKLTFYDESGKPMQEISPSKR